MNIGGAIPKKAEWKVKHIKNVIKQTINLVPSSGNVQVDAGSRIYIDLPTDTTVDLSTFVMYFNGWTDNGPVVTNGPAGYCTPRLFPRNTQSLIQNLEIQINGRSIYNVPEYNYIYNILHDFTSGTQNLNIKMIGENEDPSCDYWNNAGVITPRVGYPIGLLGDGKTSPSANNYDTYCIRNWLGLFDGSTKLINTGMFGIITIVITLAPSAVTMTGATATTAVAVAGGNQLGVPLTAGLANAVAVAAVGSSYHIDTLNFSIVRYNLPPEFYSSQANALANGAVYKLYFPNYNVYYGNPVVSTAKATTIRMSITTKSLDCVIGTFRGANYNDNGSIAPTNNVVLGNTLGANLSVVGVGSIGSGTNTFQNQVAGGQSFLLNNSKYFVRNGMGINDGTWTIGNTRLNSEKPQEQWESVLRHFNVQNDTISGVHPMYQNLNQFLYYGYAHILSLNVSGEDKDPYTVSGIDTDEVPINIQWQTTASTTAPATDAIWGIVNAAYNAAPLLIACYTSHLEIANQRQITLIP